MAYIILYSLSMNEIKICVQDVFGVYLILKTRSQAIPDRAISPGNVNSAGFISHFLEREYYGFIFSFVTSVLSIQTGNS